MLKKNQKAPNAKFINRGPAGRALNSHIMPRREIFCSEHVYCDKNALVSAGHAFAGQLICFVHFDDSAKKNAAMSFSVWAHGSSLCCQIRKENGISHSWTDFPGH